ncbi:GH36 C-terminal domain-containing protein [Gracilibacillus sp. JCM 18860]|uniref:GH36 C-terminal domain-containing protein n=1 Tax=Gracilibacillus sp. JCM 18860 TaxID=1306159 RepID=UPI003261071C
MDTRAAVAYFGTFGYELDITKLSDQEKGQVREQVAFFKENRKLIRNGEFHRLLSPFDDNITAWMVVSEDKTEALVGYYKVLAKPNEPYQRIKLTGLDPNQLYQVNNETSYYGDELMNIGIILAGNYIDRASDYWSREHPGDYQARLFMLKAL